MRCFRCLKEIGNPDDLFTHIKNVHGICGNSDFKCSLCLADFERFQTFKVHTRNCYLKTKDVQEHEQINEAFDIYHDLNMEYSDEIKDFKRLTEELALDLVLKMCSNMNVPRDLVFKNLGEFQAFITKTFILGMKTVVIPRVKLEELNAVKRFIKSVQSPFVNFNTESKLDSVLLDRGLMRPIIQGLVLEDPVKDTLDDPDDDSQMEVDLEPEIVEGSMVLMPISFTLKKFLELPHVFEKIEAHTNSIREEGKLNHFINGELWKTKLESFGETDAVIPYFLYVDGAQVNNPLGSHCRDGLLDFNYITLPSIPTEYQSILQNIIVASISPDNSHFGVECQFHYVVEKLTELATEGIMLTINNETKKVFFVCGCFTGDNKESNTYLGFAKGFSANYYCRFCRLHRSEMQQAVVEVVEKRRNRENYYEDVLTNDVSQTGIAEYSILNYIPLFHVTDSSAPDNTHIIDEGICHYNLLHSIRYFIKIRKYFTLDQLNDRIRQFDYNEDEKHNIPMPILCKTLNNKKKKKFRMTASEMFNFVHNLIFMIGDLVPEQDVVWQFVLTTIKFVDLSYIPCYIEDDITELARTIATMNSSYSQLFQDKLKPVHHFATHYPSHIRKFGPLRYLRTIRCEGKHKPMKSYAKNTTNRIDICYSIGKKTQYSFAQSLFESKGLEDIITAKILDTGSLAAKVYYGKLEPSLYKDSLLQVNCSFMNKVTVNGSIFKCGLWLPVSPDSGNCEISQVMQICDIVMGDNNDLFAVCKTYITAKQADMNIYKIDMSSVRNTFSIINIRKYLLNHQYPVGAHALRGDIFFRCKRF